MARIQTNPTQLARAFAAAEIAADQLPIVLLHLETERLERKRTMLARAVGEETAPRIGRPGWTPCVRHLKEDLRQHLRDTQRARTSFVQRFGGYTARIKAGKPEAGLMSAQQAFDLYCERLSLLYEDITTRLHLGGFFDGEGLTKTRRDLDIFVANERAEGRPAGVAHWSQWEAPATVRNIRRIFGEIYHGYALQNERSWQRRRLVPYFNSTAQGRLYEMWQQAISHVFGWGTLTASTDPETIAKAPTRIGATLDILAADTVLSEEQRAALIAYYTFTGPTSKAFVSALNEAASIATFDNKQPPYSTDPMTGMVTHEPWRRLDNDMLLRLHTHVAEAMRMGLNDAQLQFYGTYVPIVSPDAIQDEIDSRGLSAERL